MMTVVFWNIVCFTLLSIISCEVGAQPGANQQRGQLIVLESKHIKLKGERVPIELRVHDGDDINTVMNAKCAEYDPPLSSVKVSAESDEEDTICARLKKYVTGYLNEYLSLSPAKKAQHHLHLGGLFASAQEPCNLVHEKFLDAIAWDSSLGEDVNTLQGIGDHLMLAGCYESAFSMYNGAHNQSFGYHLKFEQTMHVQYEDVYSVGYPYTCRFRIRHDIDQLEYLLHDVISTGDTSHNQREVLTRALASYKSLSDDIGIGDWTTTHIRMPRRQGTTMPFSDEMLEAQEQIKLTEEQWNMIAPYYSRGLWTPSVPRLHTPAVTSRFDSIKLSQEYEDVGVVVIDNFLTPEALKALHDFALQATLWVDNKHSYLGTYLKTGFGTPLLAQVAKELEALLPDLFEDRKLKQAWAYKYDDQVQSGINIHADKAGVNLNFWTTPDEENLDPTSGGLIIFTNTSSEGLAFDEYNGDQEQANSRLAMNGFKNITVPYRCNRAVLFPSELFHTTDVFQFRRGYKSRRINFTLLYGVRADQASKRQPRAPSASSSASAGATRQDAVRAEL